MRLEGTGDLPSACYCADFWAPNHIGLSHLTCRNRNHRTPMAMSCLQRCFLACSYTSGTKILFQSQVWLLCIRVKTHCWWQGKAFLPHMYLPPLMLPSTSVSSPTAPVKCTSGTFHLEFLTEHYGLSGRLSYNWITKLNMTHIQLPHFFLRSKCN